MKIKKDNDNRLTAHKAMGYAIKQAAGRYT